MDRSRLSAIGSGAALALVALSLYSCDLFVKKAAATYLLQKSDGHYTPNGEGGSSTPIEPDVCYLDVAASRLYTANSYRGLVAVFAALRSSDWSASTTTIARFDMQDDGA